MSQRITDWVLELGFDSTKVERGLKKVDKLLMKSNRIEQKQLKLQKNKSAELRQQTSTIRARTNLSRKIEKAQSLGLKVVKETNKLSSSNSANLQKESALLDARIQKKQKELNIQKRITMEQQKGSRASKTVANSRRNVPTNAQRDSTATKAQRGSIRAADLIQVAPLSDAAQQLRSIKTELLQIEKQAGLAKTKEEMRKLNKQVSDLNFQTGRLAGTQRKAAREMTRTQTAAKGLKTSIGNLARSYVSIFAILASGAALLRVAKDFERIRSTMLLSSDGAEGAAKNFQFVQETALRLGADISATADAFAGFNVSAVSAGLSAEKSKRVFTELATAVQATGLDANRSGLAFLAFKQMLAGPVIQAQEMNQVVEQMPQFTGVARTALKELGFEGENFREIIATGTVASEEFVTSVARLLNEQAQTTGAAAKSQNNLIAAQNRMNNSLKNLADTMATSGLNDALMDIFIVMGDGLRVVTPALKVFSSLLSGLVSVITAPINAFISFTDKLGITNNLLLALGGMLIFVNKQLIFGKLATFAFSKGLLGAAGASGILSVALKGIGLALKTIWPLLAIMLALEFVVFLMDIVRGTEAWKKGIDSVNKSIRSGINWLSLMIVKFEILLQRLAIWRRAITDSGFSIDDANRMISVSQTTGKSAGLREVARRRSESVTNNASTNNEIQFNITGDNPKAIADEVNRALQNTLTGAG